MLIQRFAVSALLLGPSLVAAQDKSYAGNQVFVEKDSDAVAANFPESEIDVELLSPAFMNLDGLPKQFLRDLAKKNEWLNFHQDFFSEEGRALSYVYLTSDKMPNPGKDKGKLRILIQGHIHGNEPAGEEGILALLGKFDDDQEWTKSVLEKADIMVLPRNNPDGVEYFQRLSAGSFDLNRDWIVLGRQHTRNVKSLYSKFSPHIFVDAHEYIASDLLGTDSRYLKAEDITFCANNNQLVHKDINTIANSLFINAMIHKTREVGLRTDHYILTTPGEELVLADPDSTAQYGHHSAALLQTVSLLTESRGIKLADQHFKRRTAGTYIALKEVVDQAVNNFDLVYETVENARREFISSEEDIVITDTYREHDYDRVFIDARNGSLVNMPTTYQNHTPPVTNLTRPRPEAYVFTMAWADVAERLRVSGVEVQQLYSDYTGSVEALRIETAELAPTKFEGIVFTKVTTSQETRNVTIPAGAFWVSTRQLNAAFAMTFLEPENIVSAVNYNIIPVEEGDEYPVFRVLKDN